MKKLISILTIAAVFVGCSRTGLVREPANESHATPPISFSVEKQNITKAANLESVKHYNFGVWAWKVQGKNDLADAEVMNHYLVGFSGTIGEQKVGYDPSGCTTYVTVPGSTDDHLSPWFYEKLGKAEYTYTGTDGYYTKNDADYMSANDNQYLRYWDLAYANTNFYCYAPYNKDVTFVKGTTSSTMTFPATAIRDGYDEPLNSEYANYSRTLGEYMYAGVHAENASLNDVTVPFKHMGAQLFIRFYEEIPGYKVEIIDLNADNGTMATGITGDQTLGIQATPAVKNSTVTPVTYSNGTYYTTQGATVAFDEDDAEAHYTADWTGATTKTNTNPLMFKIPTEGLSTSVNAPANLTNYNGLGSTVHKIIKEKVTTGTQDYSYSPTIYYPVAQPTTSTTGLTFHISYRIIATDNKEVITVHNATVHVPVSVVDGETTTYITAWQPNVKYTYTFKFTKGSTGTTDPGTAIDPTDPVVSPYKSLYPIVFDAATIEDYTDNVSEYTVSEDTSYQS